MKHLFAMIFFNIVVGGIVMFRKEKQEMEDDYKAGGWYKNREKHKNRQLTVVDIYSTLGWKKTMFRPKGLFQVGVTIKNTNGALQHVGIRAVKPIMIVEF